MANNLGIKDGAGADQTVKTTDNAGVHTPHHNVDTISGPLGRAADAASVSAALSTEDVAILGATNETAPATDTATAGHNGRLQRIAQRITSLIGLFDGSALTTATATIANGASLSGSVDISGKGILRINMPASWTAAVLTFQTSMDNSTFNDLYTAAGTEYTVQAAASRSIILPPADFAGVKYIKVRSGTSGSAVNQGASRDLALVVRPLA
jgi:hypothetical protein